MKPHKMHTYVARYVAIYVNCMTSLLSVTCNQYVYVCTVYVGRATVVWENSPSCEKS